MSVLFPSITVHGHSDVRSLPVLQYVATTTIFIFNITVRGHNDPQPAEYMQEKLPVKYFVQEK